jgi:hypothetical protein
VQILNQFGELDGDLVSKQRYALWRAAEMRKALREGRAAQPPPASDASDPTAGWDAEQLQILEDEGAGASLPSTSSGLGIGAMTGIKPLNGGGPDMGDGSDAGYGPQPQSNAGPPDYSSSHGNGGYGSSGGGGGYPQQQQQQPYDEPRGTGDGSERDGSMYGGVGGLPPPEAIHTRPWEQQLHPPLMPPGLPSLHTHPSGKHTWHT